MSDPLDQLARERARELAEEHALGWAITLRAFRAAGFRRREAIQIIVAMCARPPGLNADDTERILNSLYRNHGQL